MMFNLGYACSLDDAPEGPLGATVRINIYKYKIFSKFRNIQENI